MITLTGATFGGSKDDWGTLAARQRRHVHDELRFPARGSRATVVIPNTTPAETLPPLHCSATTTCEAAGSRNYKVFTPAGLPLPRWRLNFPVTYSYDGHAASVIGHYISSVEDDNDVHPTAASAGSARGSRSTCSTATRSRTGSAKS